MHRALSCNRVGSPPSAPGIWPFPATVWLPSNVQPGAHGSYCRPSRATGCHGLAGDRPGSPPMNARLYGPCLLLPPRPMGRLELPRAAACLPTQPDLSPGLTAPGALVEVPPGSCSLCKGSRGGAVLAFHCLGLLGQLSGVSWEGAEAQVLAPGPHPPAHLDGVRDASRPPDPVPRPQSSSPHPLL